MKEIADITSLIVEQENSGKPIVASSYASTLGIPALFHRSSPSQTTPARKY